jgi:hypothetical protein
VDQPEPAGGGARGGRRPLLTGNVPLTAVATLDAVLDAHAAALGEDLVAYRNHAYRVVNFCVALSSADAETVEKAAIAAAFHDLGIWTAGTFDYLPPSVGLATAHLVQSDRAGWVPEVEAMILEHHKISPYRTHADWLVEPFRKADWVDVSRGFLAFGLSRKFRADVFSAWPNAGFHRRLVQLSLRRLRTHPWNPLPMMRL